MPLIGRGSWLFYSAGLEDEVNRVSVNGGDSVSVPLPAGGAKLIDLSPDASKLLVGRRIGSDAEQSFDELWVVPLPAGTPRRLGNVVVENNAAAWSHDGQQLIYAINNELHLARGDGSEVRKVATVSGVPNFLRWSPDGSKVRFTLPVERSFRSSLWEVSLKTGSLRHLIPEWNPSVSVCCGDWSPDGGYFVFRAQRSEISNLWALREHPGLHWGAREPVQVTNGPVSALFDVFSADGKRLYIDGFQGRREFFSFNLLSRQLVPELVGVSGVELEYSKDGQWVTYVSIPIRRLWRSAADGSQPFPLTSVPLDVRRPHWSPDGHLIAFSGAPPNARPRIYVVPFEGGAPEQVTHGEAGPDGEGYFSWSPDGASLVFSSGGPTATGETRLHKIDLQTGIVSTIPGTEGMFIPRWSPDRRFIAGLAGPQWKLSLYDIATQKQTEISNAQSVNLSWSRDGKSLFFINGSGTDQALWRLRMSDRKLEQIVSLKTIPISGGHWFEAGLNNSLMISQSIGIDEIYALDWIAP